MSCQLQHFEGVMNESPIVAFSCRCQRCTPRWFAGWCRHCYDWPPTRRVTPRRLLRWHSWAVCLFRSCMKMPSNCSSHCIPSPTMSPCECSIVMTLRVVNIMYHDASGRYHLVSQCEWWISSSITMRVVDVVLYHNVSGSYHVVSHCRW